MPDSAGAAGDKHGPAVEGADGEAIGPAVGLGQGTVRREGGDAQAGTDVERRPVRQGHRLAGRQYERLLRRAITPPPRRLPDPHPLADARRVHTVADGVDDSGTVLVRHPLVERAGGLGAAEAGLPIGRVDARDVDPHAYLTRPRHRVLPAHQRQDLRAAGDRVDDRSHTGILIDGDGAAAWVRTAASHVS